MNIFNESNNFTKIENMQIPKNINKVNWKSNF